MSEKRSRCCGNRTGIKEIVSTQKQYRKPDPKVFGMFIYYMMRPILVFLFNKTRYFHLEKKFCAEENCTGCGLCEKVCLSGKIKMIDGKPVWDKKVNCYFCFACIHYCPVKAIQIKGSKSKERGRYHHSDVSAAEIMKEKESYMN
ncbi:MAG: EFR1 family ferrodoxin [Oscillospiraceae bacterium]|nr:EFR1 family ferrodoxin [Oscillospiraceae bacterium]